MTDRPVSRRHPASQVPGITGIQLTPGRDDATLVNISSSGVLVECGTKVAPREAVTVSFKGTFTPSSVEGRVVRCSVARIDKNSTLRYYLGIAFNQEIPLDADQADVQQDPLPETPRSAPAASRPAAPPEARNRW